MRPLMYGYLRMDLADGRIEVYEQILRDYATSEGFDLAMVFRERDDNSHAALAALIDELRRADARHVSVPSVDHLAGAGRSWHEAADRLHREAGAKVLVADRTAMPWPGPAIQRVEPPTELVAGDLAPTTVPRDRLVEITLAATATAAATARLHVRLQLLRWRLDGLIDSIEGAVSRLVDDAVALITHIDLLAVRIGRTSDHVLIEVWDSRPVPQPPQPLLDAELNQDLGALCQRHGRFRPANGGLVTWCEFRNKAPIASFEPPVDGRQIGRLHRPPAPILEERTFRMPEKVRKDKVLAYIVRDGKLLVFRHTDYSYEEVGIQVPAGSIQPDETPEDAALREAREETGLTAFRVVRKLGEIDYDISPYRWELQHRHVFHLELDEPTPERWASQEDHDGELPPTHFECFWMPLEAAHILQSGQGALLGRLFDDPESPS